MSKKQRLKKQKTENSAKLRKTNKSFTQPSTSRLKTLFFPVSTASIILTVLLFFIFRGAHITPTSVPTSSKNALIQKAQNTEITNQKGELLPSLNELLDAPGAQLENMNVGMINLTVAAGLMDTPYNLDPLVLQMNQWVEAIRFGIERHRYRFNQNPSEFDNSEGKFSVLVMNTILKEDFGISYNPDRISDPTNLEPSLAGLTFFRDPDDIFITGLLNSQQMGTCASIPVIFAAIGQRLGLPIKLVCGKGHLFCRWEDQRERFNIEVTNKGVSFEPDEYYRKWPFPISSLEEKQKGYLRSLTKRESLAIFLQARASCLMANRIYKPAHNVMLLANQFAPGFGDVDTGLIMAAQLVAEKKIRARQNLQNYHRRMTNSAVLTPDPLNQFSVLPPAVKPTLYPGSPIPQLKLSPAKLDSQWNNQQTPMRRTLPHPAAFPISNSNQP